MSQEVGQSCSQEPGPSRKAQEASPRLLQPAMLQGYRVTQGGGKKRKPKQTKSQEAGIQRKPRKKKAPASQPLIGGVSDSDVESEDPPVPPRSRNTKKKKKVPGELSETDVESVDNPAAPPNTKKKKKKMDVNLTLNDSDEDTNSELDVVLDAVQNPDQELDVSVSDSILDA